MRVQTLLSMAGLVLAGLLALSSLVAVVGQCSFNSVSGVNFGSYDVCNTSHTHSTGSITYNCITLDTPITIDLSKGNATSYGPRQMRRGAYTLDYNLFLDSNIATIWGDGKG